MKLRTILMLLFIIVILLSAAQSDDYRILEDLGFTNATSYDLVEVEKDGEQTQLLRVVNSVPKKEPESKASREILEAVANTNKQARIIMSRQTNRILVSGQLRSVLFGMGISKAGIWPYIDTLVRDPAISQRVRVVVVNGSAAELLKTDYPAYPNTGIYIFELLMKESQTRSIPNVNLYHFTRDLYDDGIDPVTPIIRQGQDSISVDGIALFQDDKYVGRIEPDNALIFACLRGTFRKGQIGLTLNSKEEVLLSAVSSKRQLKVMKDDAAGDDSYSVSFHIELEGALLEYIGPKDVSEVKGQQQLSRELEEYIKNEAEKMIQSAQQLQSDCFGIGQKVRNTLSAAQWYGMDWKSVYPNVKATVTVKVGIKNYGKFQ